MSIAITLTKLNNNLDTLFDLLCDVIFVPDHFILK